MKWRKGNLADLTKAGCRSQSRQKPDPVAAGESALCNLAEPSLPYSLPDPGMSRPGPRLPAQPVELWGPTS
ncbi:hypothetical protein Cadr_000003693 [Camelus dromedarius]|uniref:Uncharacterized protein n=1 Tax=Camelus dromedarius TaxID=9838 RepID=A0A5N4C1K4_CAMDR|nr:hypothetical protein Cadr_000003693 [Camelus dromedarius]